MYRCPSLEHLNLMKNPCNPVFTNQTVYSQFRAKFALWVPTLKTLDGTNFNDDQSFIAKMKAQEQSKMARVKGDGGLATIPEEKGSSGVKQVSYSSLPSRDDGVDKSVKA
mmetsp:Transcript_19339/g.29645  ORF Transcript_19339/g.29645 Transcript_19339/m.29645 type:complete len:110 (+) Transcript_19339:334-663(+)